MPIGRCAGSARLIDSQAVAGRLGRACAVSATVVVLAGCGGGGDGASSDPSSQNYDPAKTTLKEAGLEVCSEVQEQPVHGLGSESGVIAVRAFDVARDCNGAKTSPNEITVYQFDGRSSLDAGLVKIRAAYPRAEVEQYGAVVIVATGPDRVAYMADVGKALAPTEPATTTG
jgi:hypothetical protein